MICEVDWPGCIFISFINEAKILITNQDQISIYEVDIPKIVTAIQKNECIMEIKVIGNNKGLNYFFYLFICLISFI